MISKPSISEITSNPDLPTATARGTAATSKAPLTHLSLALSPLSRRLTNSYVLTFG